MEEFISLPFKIEKGTIICFDSIDDAVTVVQKVIKNKDKLPDTKYFDYSVVKTFKAAQVAFFISSNIFNNLLLLHLMHSFRQKKFKRDNSI